MDCEFQHITGLIAGLCLGGIAQSNTLPFWAVFLLGSWVGYVLF
jgi:hypothetical protein